MMVMPPIVLFLCPLTLFMASSVSSAAQDSKPNSKEDLELLALSHTHVQWPIPESLVNDLQANDDQTRLRALAQIGASERQTTADRPSEVELRYASLGTGEEEQAIVAINIGPMLFGAVAAQQNGAWLRIASFSC